MSGTYVSIESREGSFQAYLALPEQGSGPGLVLLQEIFGINAFLRGMADRFAEEGYVVMVPDLFWRLEPGLDLGYEGADLEKAFELYQRFDAETSIGDIAATLDALRAREEQVGGVGCLGFCLGGLLAYLTAARTDADCAIGYYGVGIENHLDEAAKIRCPTLLHLAEEDPFVPEEAQRAIAAAADSHGPLRVARYPGCQHAFASPTREHYDKPATLMAYSRSLAVLRDALGPYYDLEEIWDRHTYLEFEARDVDATMATMVAEPYVNHIPTMTGGVGYERLRHFYANHFVHANPEDTRLIPISRTVGTDRLVDEMLFCFTHTREIPWMLPGVAPTGRYVEIPLVAIVNFRGDKLYHEHIYWDQASVLVQLGLIDAEGLPVAGVDTAKKLVDESRPSNLLMGDSWKGPA